MGEVRFRVALALLLCVVAPTLGVRLIIDYVEISWMNIFMVSGAESLWVYLCLDMSRWILAAWRER